MTSLKITKLVGGGQDNPRMDKIDSISSHVAGIDAMLISHKLYGIYYIVFITIHYII